MMYLWCVYDEYDVCDVIYDAYDVFYVLWSNIWCVLWSIYDVLWSIVMFYDPFVMFCDPFMMFYDPFMMCCDPFMMFYDPFMMFYDPFMMFCDPLWCFVIHCDVYMCVIRRGEPDEKRWEGGARFIQFKNIGKRSGVFIGGHRPAWYIYLCRTYKPFMTWKPDRVRCSSLVFYKLHEYCNMIQHQKTDHVSFFPAKN